MKDEKKQKTLNLRIDEETHSKLKVLAAKEKKTIKHCIFEGLDKAFPGWSNEEKK